MMGDNPLPNARHMPKTRSTGSVRSRQMSCIPLPPDLHYVILNRDGKNWSMDLKLKQDS